MKRERQAKAAASRKKGQKHIDHSAKTSSSSCCPVLNDKIVFFFEADDMAVVTIENFPPEVLELIFKELNLKDTGNCSLTCLKWQRLIAALYKDKCKLI